MTRSDSAATRRFMAGLREIEVHCYEFSSDRLCGQRNRFGAPSAAIPGWKRVLVQTHSALKHEECESTSRLEEKD